MPLIVNLNMKFIFASTFRPITVSHNPLEDMDVESHGERIIEKLISNKAVSNFLSATRIQGPPLRIAIALHNYPRRPFLSLRHAFREFGDCQSIRALFIDGVIMNINGEIINYQALSIPTST